MANNSQVFATDTQEGGDSFEIVPQQESIYDSMEMNRKIDFSERYSN